MVKRKINWSHRARINLYKILEFFIKRNKSKSYSVKLYDKFNRELNLLRNHPDVGIKTEITNVRGLIVDDYILYYEIDDKYITVHMVWDCRQNPDDLIIK